MMLECLLFQGEKVFGPDQGGGELHSAGGRASAELVIHSGAILRFANGANHGGIRPSLGVFASGFRIACITAALVSFACWTCIILADGGLW
jgi:hypothetical protein